MPSTPPRTPKYRHYKPKDLAVVRIDGKDHYLGKYGSPESHERYRRLLAEWLSSKAVSVVREQPSDGTGSSPPPAIYVNELILAYWTHAKSYYVKRGRATDEQAGIRSALRYVRRLYGRTRADEFSPLKLKAVRQAMIDTDLSRRVVNQYVQRIRRMFRWGVENELVPVEVYQALMTVSGLRKGRSKAREIPPVPPVPDEHIEATLPHLPEIVQAMVRFKRLTGCRPEDVCNLRPADINRSDGIWCCEPASHKMDHTKHRRRFYIGPKAQKVLLPWLDRRPDAYCFCPRESADASLAKRRRNGKARSVLPQTKLTQRRNRNRAPGDHYTRYSYRQAIERACKRAEIPVWSPNRLRHTRGTEIRHRYGLEAAQVTLGHARADVTEIYAEKNLEMAVRIARETG